MFVATLFVVPVSERSVQRKRVCGLDEFSSIRHARSTEGIVKE